MVSFVVIATTGGAGPSEGSTAEGGWFAREREESADPSEALRFGTAGRGGRCEGSEVEEKGVSRLERPREEALCEEEEEMAEVWKGSGEGKEVVTGERVTKDSEYE
jgi:hypothetical protein